MTRTRPQAEAAAGVVGDPPRGLRAPGAWAVLALLPAAVRLLLRGRRR